MTTRTLLFGLSETGLNDYRSDAERDFLEALHCRAQAAGWAGDAWAHNPYLTVTVTLVAAGTKAVRRTLRVDFDGHGVTVGDDSSGQLVDDLDPTSPDVLVLSGRPIPELAAFAADWIERELAANGCNE